MSDAHDPRNFLIRKEGDAHPGHPTDYAGFTNKLTWAVWSSFLEEGVLDYWLDFVKESSVKEVWHLAPCIKRHFEEMCAFNLSNIVLEFVLWATSEVDWRQVAGKLLEYFEDCDWNSQEKSP